MKDPSWSELGHFVQFLNLQFLSCEASVFCNETLVGDVMAGLKSFVVKFMIRMSKVNVTINSLSIICFVGNTWLMNEI